MFEDLDKLLNRDAPKQRWPLWGKTLVGGIIVVPAVAVLVFFLIIVT